MVTVEQDDLSIYSIFNSHETPGSISTGSSAGHQLVDSSSTFNDIPSAIYAHQNYSPAPHCMYEQPNYSVPTEDQQSSAVSSYPWWHSRAIATTPTTATASNNNSATQLHHRTYPYGNSNYVPLHQHQQQSTSPTDERSSSVQSYVSSPSCTSIQSPVMQRSPANAASNNFASNSNSPVAHQSTNQALGQQQINFQELYSPVCRF